MGMFDFLRTKKLLPKVDSLTIGDLKSWKHQQFILLSVLENSDFKGDKKNPSEEEFIAWINDNAERIAADESCQTFLLENDGQTIVPVFSSADTAQIFVQSSPDNVWNAFVQNQMAGDDLIRYLSDDGFEGTVIVLDLHSPTEQQFEHEQIKTIGL